ncbi:hybrid sensor histidine kinase/response regulator [Vibrio mimicus]
MYISINDINNEYRNIKYLVLFLIFLLFMLIGVSLLECKTHMLFKKLAIYHSNVNKIDATVYSKNKTDREYKKILSVLDSLREVSFFYDDDFIRLSAEYGLTNTLMYEIFLLSKEKNDKGDDFERNITIDKKKAVILAKLTMVNKKLLFIENELNYNIGALKLSIIFINVISVIYLICSIRKKYIFLIDDVIVPLIRIRRSLDYGDTNLDIDNMKSKEVVDLISYIRSEYLYRKNLIDELASLNRNNEEKRIKQKRLIEFATHEMRTPTNSICGNVDLILKNNKNIEYSNAIDDIRTSANVLLNVINEFLDYSKLEASMYAPDLVEIDVIKVMNDTKKITRTTAIRDGIDLNFEFDSKELPLQIKSNENCLRQILVNIISNSIAHTPSGGNVTVICLSNSNENFRIDILDTGPGIPSEMINEIFEPFIQVDNNKRVGTGLGLTICKKFSELLNINLLVESNKDGSKFSLLFSSPCSKSISLTDLLIEKSIFNVAYVGNKSLQFQNNFEYFTNASLIKEDDFDLIVSVNSGESNKGSHILNLEGTDVLDFIFELESRTPDHANDYIYTGRILVVEDNELNRKLMMRIFEQYSLDFQFAVNGKEAVDIALSQSFDLILMDLEMPEMNGFDATLVIKQESNVPIIALSASFVTNKDKFCKKHAFDSYLQKPFTIDELFEVIHSS